MFGNAPFAHQYDGRHEPHAEAHTARTLGTQLHPFERRRRITRRHDVKAIVQVGQFLIRPPFQGRSVFGTLRTGTVTKVKRVFSSKSLVTYATTNEGE